MGTLSFDAFGIKTQGWSGISMSERWSVVGLFKFHYILNFPSWSYISGEETHFK